MKKKLLVAALVVATWSPAYAQDPLTAARELYAAASYEEALTALGRLRPSADQATLERIDQYRAFSLFALGRTPEAQDVVDGLIKMNPAMTLTDADASPRILAMFTDARRRLLPEIIRTHYRAAKTAFDAKDYARAEPELILVKNALAAAETVGVLDATSAALGDVVNAFVDLVHATTSAPPPAAAAAAPTAASAAAAAPATVPAAPVIYDALSEGVAVPVTLKQSVPSMPSDVVRQLRERQKNTPGVISVLIDETGRVERASMLVSLHPGYDRMILDAARNWLYKPALKNGVAVKFEKTISLSPPTQ